MRAAEAEATPAPIAVRGRRQLVCCKSVRGAVGGRASLRERESWPSSWQRVKRKDCRIDSKTRRCCASSLVRHAGAVYWPRDCGSTLAKVRKSVILKVLLLAGNVGRQRGRVAR